VESLERQNWGTLGVLEFIGIDWDAISKFKGSWGEEIMIPQTKRAKVGIRCSNFSMGGA